MKKLLSILLAVSFAFALMVPAAFADDLDLTGQIVILHTNDMHGHIYHDAGGTYEPTMAYVQGLKEHYENRGAYVLLLDAGDAVYGSPAADGYQGASVITVMNSAGYDAMALGDHDFNYGFAQLMVLKSYAQFPILSSNFTRTADGTHPFDAYKIFDSQIADGTGTTKIAVVGVSTPRTKTNALAKFTEGYDFGDTNQDGIVTAAELAAIIQKNIDAVKDQGADIVIVLGHLGDDGNDAPWRSTDMIPLLNNIDFFIDGHSHSNISEIVSGVRLTSAGAHMQQIGHINICDGDISINRIHDFTEMPLGKLTSRLLDAYYSFVQRGNGKEITYDANGGTRYMPRDYAKAGEPFMMPDCDFTPPAGKRFKAWAVGSADGSRVNAGETYTFTADTTVYAIWEDLPRYNIIEGAGGVWTEGSENGLGFKANGEHGKFTDVLVDGNEIGSGNYTDESGSTVITLKASYLKTLPAGRHTLRIVFTDGYAETTFLISAPANVPKAGDRSMPGLWLAVLLLSAGALAASAMLGRRKRHGN